MGKATQHGRSKLVGPEDSHVQEEACARSAAAKGLKEKVVGHVKTKEERDK